jgi:ammonia channel protein AmtB
LFGYSLVFSDNPKSQFIGSGANAVFSGLTDQNAFANLKSVGIPGLVFALFQGMFAAFT